SKRVFLYTIAIHSSDPTNKGIVVPIAEALVACHYEDDLKRMLCMDWSWALINATMQMFIKLLQLHLVVKKFVSFAPIWTNMMGNMVETTDKTRISNSPIESYFNITKNVTLKGKRFVRPSYYVRKSKRYIQAKIKNIRNSFSRIVKDKPRKRRNETLIEDQWRSTPKKNEAKCQQNSNEKIPHFAKCIYLHEFQTLNPRNEIFNNIIELYCNIIFLKNNIMDCECLPCEVGIALFNSKTRMIV
ncbi:hypothetical protein CVS40_5797, partial [Lucilia cuprina]